MSTVACQACGISFKSSDALRRHTERYCELSVSMLSTFKDPSAASAPLNPPAYKGKGKGPLQQPTPSNADQLLAKRRQQAKAGNDGKIAELIHARQGLQTDLGELEHGYARVGHTSRAADAVRLHKLGQRGNTLTGEASAAAVQYAEKLQLLKDAKIREMRLVIAKAEEKEGLKELDRKHLLDRQKRGAYELDQIEKERSAMRRQLEAAEQHLQVVHHRLDAKSSKMIPGHNGSVLTRTHYSGGNKSTAAAAARAGYEGPAGTKAMFNDMDADGSGGVTKAEFDEWSNSKRLGNALGREAGSSKKQSVTFGSAPSLGGSLLWEAHQILGSEQDEAHAKLQTERSALELKRAKIEKELEELKVHGTKGLRRKKVGIHPQRRKSVHHIHEDPHDHSYSDDDDDDDGGGGDGGGGGGGRGRGRGGKRSKKGGQKRPSTMPQNANNKIQSNMPNEAQAMREKYLAQGGADPLVLRQIQDLEQTLNATARSGSGGLNGRGGGAGMLGSPGGPGMHSTGYSMLGASGGGSGAAGTSMFSGQPMHLQNQLMRMELDQKRMQQDFMYSIQHLEQSMHGDDGGGGGGGGGGRAGGRVGSGKRGMKGGNANGGRVFMKSPLGSYDGGDQSSPHYNELQRLRAQAAVLKEKQEVADLRRALGVDGGMGDGGGGYLRDVVTPLGQDHDVFHSEPYNPPDGMALFLDFCSGLPGWLENCAIECELHTKKGDDVSTWKVDPASTNSFMEDVKIQDRPATGSAAIKVQTDRRHPITFPHGTVFASKFQQANPSSYIFVQLLEGTRQRVKEKRTLGESVLCLGWTKLFLFDDQDRLCAGRWQLQLRDPPVKKGVSSFMLRELPRAGPAEVCVRLVDGNLHPRHMRLDVVPDRKLYFPDGPIGYDVGREAGAGGGGGGGGGGGRRSIIDFPDEPLPVTAYGGRDSHGVDGEPSSTLRKGKGARNTDKGGDSRKSAGDALSRRTRGKQWGATKGGRAVKGGGKGMTKLQLRKAAKAEAAAAEAVASGKSPESPDGGRETPGGGSTPVTDNATSVQGTPGAGVDDAPIVFEVTGVDGISVTFENLHVTANVFKMPPGEEKPEPLMEPWQSRTSSNVNSDAVAAVEAGGRCLIDDETSFPFPFPAHAKTQDTVVAVRVFSHAPAEGAKEPELVGWHLFELFDDEGALVPFDRVLELYSADLAENFDNMTEDKQMANGAGITVKVSQDADIQANYESETLKVQTGCPPEAWTPYVRPDPPERPFNLETGGFDLYIDAAKSLPRNCSISRVTGRIFSHDYEKQGGQVSANVELDSSIFDPNFGFRLEFRDVVFSPTSTLLVKVYTIELQSKELCTVGYCALNIFCMRGTMVQPGPDMLEKVAVSLNDGGHQLPLFNTAPDTSKELTLAAFDSQPKVPCASLLVRLINPPELQGKLLSTSTVPKENWGEAGLVVKAPPYTSAYYASYKCEPTKDEVSIFRSLMEQETILARDCLGMINGDRRLKDDSSKKSWIRSRLTKSSGGGNPPAIDLSFIVPYSEKAGFTIAVDSAMNLPKAKIYYAVMRLTSEEENTHSDIGGDIFGNMMMDWAGPPVPLAKHPMWLDGYKKILNHVGDKSSTLLVEIYAFGEKGAKSVTPVAWTMMQVLKPDINEKGTGLFAKGGIFKLPLYAGATPKFMLTGFCNTEKGGGQQSLDRARAQRKIKYIDGASVTVRVTDSRRRDEVNPEDEPDAEFLPKEKKYKTIAKSKTVIQVLGKSGPPEKVDAAVREWMDKVISHLRAT